MLHLPDITLCCVDTHSPSLGLDALQRSMEKVRFGEVIFFTRKGCLNTTSRMDAIRIIDIEEIKSIEDYSMFMLQSLANYLRTSHSLVVQWDGYVIHPDAWSDEFLSYDYIGAPWRQKDGLSIVGNGGFSLRSRKLLGALLSEDMQLHHPEDDCIAKTNRTLLEKRYGIRFAEPAIADMFSFEFTKPKAPTFGFHGFCHFPDVMPPEDLHHFVRTMPGHFVFNEYFPMFLERLCRKVRSNPLYGETMALVQQAISEAFAQAGISGRIPGKNFIKALIRCQLGSLAKTGLETRIASSGYSATNIRLFARYFGGKLRFHP